MSDIGAGRFLPPLMRRLRETAPGVRVETLPLRPADIAVALDEGRIDFAFGFLPKVKDTRRQHLLQDRYIVLLRAGHPFARRRLRGAPLLALHDSTSGMVTVCGLVAADRELWEDDTS